MTTTDRKSDSVPSKLEPVEVIALERPFIRVEGHCWKVQLPAALEADSDEPVAPRRSRWFLTEDGRLIGAPHAVHQNICDYGCGAHSHWRDTLYFATSDNSDPNCNGRLYELRRERRGGDERTIWNLSPPYRNLSGKLWAIALPSELHDRTDNAEKPRRSRLRLLEDGRELGPRHAPHAAIEARGEGLYSFWNEAIYFSTLDGDDPNTNGRRYSVRIEEKEIGIPTLTPKAVSGTWWSPNQGLRCAIIGMGNRGMYLARLVGQHEGVDLRWVIDHSDVRLKYAREQIAISGVQLANSWNAAIADPAIDIVFVTLPDHLHTAPAIAAFRNRKHLYVEKPIATTLDDARAILRAWQRSERQLQIGYVLRHAPFYTAIREVIRQGLLGRILMVLTGEQLDVMHGASFMRRWHAQSANSGGLVVHKCCHDLDLLCWLFDSRPQWVASFGGLETFVRPPPASFCSECGERWFCAYADNAVHESRSPEEIANPTIYGLDRCVFREDKDIVDNQILAFEMASGLRGAHHLTMHGALTERSISVIGDAARLDGNFQAGSFTVNFSDQERDAIVWNVEEASAGSHGGGDVAMLRQFFNACAGQIAPRPEAPEAILAGHVFSLAAERARQTKQIVRLDERDFLLTHSTVGG